MDSTDAHDIVIAPDKSVDDRRASLAAGTSVPPRALKRRYISITESCWGCRHGFGDRIAEPHEHKFSELNQLYLDIRHRDIDFIAEQIATMHLKIFTREAVIRNYGHQEWSAAKVKEHITWHMNDPMRLAFDTMESIRLEEKVLEENLYRRLPGVNDPSASETVTDFKVSERLDKLRLTKARYIQLIHSLKK